MISQIQCQRILKDHPRIHPQSLAGKEYKRLGLGSLPFLSFSVPVKDQAIWDYQKHDEIWHRSETHVAHKIVDQAPASVGEGSLPSAHRISSDAPAPPSVAVRVDNSSFLESVTVDHTETQTQEHISAQIHDLGLRGLDALVFIFFARHGSLEGVFEYMDANNSGQVSLNAWTTCLLVMHIHLEQLVGMAPSEIFGMMDTHNSSTISKSEFLDFFRQVTQKSKSVQSQHVVSESLGVKEPERNVSNLFVDKDEEAKLLSDLGSLEQKLNVAQPKKASGERVARQGRPPRPKPLKLR